jgi:hypothetical protein
LNHDGEKQIIGVVCILGTCGIAEHVFAAVSCDALQSFGDFLVALKRRTYMMIAL